jgi:hypothetical protein
MDEPLPIGKTVGVTLGWVLGGAPALSAPARVVRCVADGQRHVVGVEFVRPSSAGASGIRPRSARDQDK